MNALLPILEVHNVTFGYKETHVLENVSFSINPTDFLAIIGPNGGGKTTLIKLIMGTLSPQQGSITVFGETPAIGRKYIGYVPQFNPIDTDYPIQVWEVVFMNRLLHHPFQRYNAKAKKDVLRALDWVGIAHLYHRSLSALSGGEKQRVFLARALLNSPRLLILDEPTSSVDFYAEKGFFELLKALNQNMAIVMITHDLSVVSRTVKQVACLNVKLIYHGDKELTEKDFEEVYGCPIELIAHGTPHRVLGAHHDHH